MIPCYISMCKSHHGFCSGYRSPRGDLIRDIFASNFSSHFHLHSHEPVASTLLIYHIEEDNIRILLCLQKACSEVGIKLPWDEVGSMIGPTITGGAVQQHVAKLRTRAADAGIPVPGPMRRGSGVTPSANPRSSRSTPKKASHTPAKRIISSKAKSTSTNITDVDLTSDSEYGEIQTARQPTRTNVKGKASAVALDMAGHAVRDNGTAISGKKKDMGPGVQSQPKRKRGLTRSSPASSNVNATGQSTRHSSVDGLVSNGSGFRNAMSGHVAAGAGFMDPSQSGSQTPMSRSTGVIDLTDDDGAFETTSKGVGNQTTNPSRKIAILKVGKSKQSLAVLKAISVPGALGAALNIPSPYPVTRNHYNTGISDAATFGGSSSTPGQAVSNNFFMTQREHQFYAPEPPLQYASASYAMPPPPSKRPRMQTSPYDQTEYVNDGTSSAYDNYDFTPIPFNPLPPLGAVEYGQAMYQPPYQVDPFAMPAANFNPNRTSPFGYAGIDPVSQPFTLGYSQPQPTYQPYHGSSIPQGHAPVDDELQIIQYVPNIRENNDTESQGRSDVTPSNIPNESAYSTFNGGSSGSTSDELATASHQNDSAKEPSEDEFADFFNDDTGEASFHLESSEGFLEEGPTSDDVTAATISQQLADVQTVGDAMSQLFDEVDPAIFPNGANLDLLTNSDDIFGGDFGDIDWGTMSGESAAFSM